MVNPDKAIRLQRENERLKAQIEELKELERQHKLSVEELKSTTERLKKIFAAAPDAVLILTHDGTCVQVNKVVEDALGSKMEDIIGKNFFEISLLSKNYLDKVRKGIEENKKGKKYGPFEVSYISRDGKQMFSEISTFPIKFDENALTLLVIRDITEQKKSARIIAENEKRLSLHINQTPLGFIEWDLDFKVRRWNPSAERIFGYTKEEAIGKHVSFILPPFTLPNVEKVWDKILMSKRGRKNINENVKKNGDVVLCEWFNSRLVNKNNQVVSVASWVQDITERSRAEKIKKVLYNISNAVNTNDNLHKLIGFIRDELSAIIDTTNFYIALYNEKNDTITLPFFVDEKDQFTEIPAGKTLTKYVVKIQKPLLVNSELQSELERRGEMEMVGADSKVWLGIPLKTEGKVTGVLVVQSYTDENAFNSADVKMLEFVSDQISLSINRKKTEEELVAALKKAEESDKLKTAFLQNMSHEIRTPMSGILGFTSLLKESGEINTKQLEYLRIIEKSGERMLNTINDLMDISKVESGQMDVENSEININELIDYTQTFFYPEAKAKGLEISSEKGLSSEESVIVSDKEKLYAILTNLVKNAIKYTPKGTIKFGYRVKKSNLLFFVEDSGIGIPKEELNNVFDRFVQVHKNLSSEYEGTGLGLSITKAYVEMLGGTIGVKSEHGKGSKFYFEIPYKKDVVIQKKAKPEKEQKTGGSIGQKQIKILIAEDDETIRKYLSIVVRKISSDVIFAKNGIEAVEICKTNANIDLVLMDIKMPAMDGYEATREIRKFNKSVVIVAQTAFAFESEQEKAKAVGCNDYITKPVTRNKIIEIIGKYFV